MLPSARSPVPSPDRLGDAWTPRFLPPQKTPGMLLLDSARHVLLQHGLLRCACRDVTECALDVASYVSTRTGHSWKSNGPPLGAAARGTNLVLCVLSSCCTFRLKRRNAFSRDSSSWSLTSAN